ncbi:MAG: hypothetical protein FWG26_06450 [Betaproteobacteria bacterium]|nr:hypothetical protein [Betaproteobacteria bacterium]
MKEAKLTHKKIFLSKMERVLHWSRLEALVELHYFVKETKGSRSTTSLPMMCGFNFCNTGSAQFETCLSSYKEAMHALQDHFGKLEKSG